MRIGINLSPFVQLQRGGASRTASGGFSSLLSLVPFDQRRADATLSEAAANAKSESSSEGSAEPDSDAQASQVSEETAPSVTGGSDSSSRGRIFSETFRRLPESDLLSSRAIATEAAEQRRRLIDLLV
jgi:hypothetical protein